jgi:hypothetical protein
MGWETGMGKIPVILVGLIALWIAFNVVTRGPGEALGGLFGLLDEPQYGEADRETRQQRIAEKHLGPQQAPEDPDRSWWGE